MKRRVLRHNARRAKLRAHLVVFTFCSRRNCSVRVVFNLHVTPPIVIPLGARNCSSLWKLCRQGSFSDIVTETFIVPILLQRGHGLFSASAFAGETQLMLSRYNKKAIILMMFPRFSCRHFSSVD